MSQNISPHISTPFGASTKHDCTLGEGGGLATMRTKTDRGREGGGLAVSGHPFQCCCIRRGEGIYKLFYHHLLYLKIET